MEHVFLLLAFILLVFFGQAETSTGDASPVHEDCMQICIIPNCTTTSRLRHFASRQPLSHKLLLWSCVDECKYQCMWESIEWFKQENMSVPQFFGKWPFVRFMGIQEPASTVFSVLNGLVHWQQFLKFRSAVPSNAPFFKIHLTYALVSVNAWIWSTIFHTRDTILTEMMDYFSAQLVIVCSTYFLLLRVFGVNPMKRTIALGVGCLAFYIRHVYYMAFVRFDYSYNMMVGVMLGVTNMLGWASWSFWHWTGQPYVWKCAATVISVNLLLVLEVGDFQPIWYTFDAHSLWHCGTIPLPILWYSFAVDDCWYLMRKDSLKKV